MISEISVHSLLLKIHLGWSESERSETQTVEVDIRIRPTELPKACQSDELEDTACYDEICSLVMDQFDQSTHKLIESLGFKIYKSLQEKLTKSKIQVSLLKPSPPISNLKKGARFTVGDF